MLSSLSLINMSLIPCQHHHLQPLCLAPAVGRNCLTTPSSSCSPPINVLLPPPLYLFSPPSIPLPHSFAFCLPPSLHSPQPNHHPRLSLNECSLTSGTYAAGCSIPSLWAGAHPCVRVFVCEKGRRPFVYPSLCEYKAVCVRACACVCVHWNICLLLHIGHLFLEWTDGVLL